MALTHDASVTAVSNKRYWQVDVVTGGLGNARVTLAVRDERIVSDEGKVVVTQAASVSDVFRSAGRALYTGTSLNGAVTSSDMITLPLLAVGVVNDNGSVLVYNAVSPNGDGLNDFLRIGNIESFPNNRVSLFNRWGDKVFEMSGYDNREKVFRGKRNVGGGDDLLPGTYYYAIDRSNGAPVVNGYFSLK
jgi:gliding motility-associated-like protein